LRIIGDGSEEEKTKVENSIEKRLNDSRSFVPENELDRLHSVEYKKGEVEKSAINFSNKYTANLLKQAGVPNFDIPGNNYYFLPNEEYNRVSDSGGNATANPSKKIIALNSLKVGGKPLFMALVVLHETIHLKSFLSIELNKDEEVKDKSTFREGVVVHSAKTKDEEAGFSHSHFLGLQEAIIANLEKRALSEISKLPELQDEIDRLNKPEVLEKKKKIAEKRKISIEDIVWVSDTTEDYNMISYPRTRAVLDYVCDEIQKKFPEQYKNADKVFQEFSNAQFNGRLLTIARLVEETFGEGSFRILGNMDTDPNSAALCLEKLKKLRLMV